MTERFLDHVVNKKTDFVRVYLPPDANTLLCVADHCCLSPAPMRERAKPSIYSSANS